MLFPPPLPTDADRLVLQDVTAKLRSALHLPATRPALAHWLFGNPTEPFHLDGPMVPPSVFKDALAIRISHTFTDFVAANPFAIPPVSCGLPLRATPTSTNSLHLLLAVVAQEEGVARGYVMAMGQPTDGLLLPFKAGMFQGRFVIDLVKERRMLVVLNGVTPELSSVFYMAWKENNVRERYFFAVPNEEYAFERLPSKVVALLRNIEFKVDNADQLFEFWNVPGGGRERAQETPSGDGAKGCATIGGYCEGDSATQGTDLSSREDDSLRSSVQPDARMTESDLISWSAAFIEGLDDVDVGSSHAPVYGPSPLSPGFVGKSFGNESAVSPHLSGGDLRSYMETVGWTAAVEHRRGNATTATANDIASAIAHTRAPFDLSPLADSLSSIERMLGGKFFGPRLSRDIMNPLTGEVTSRTTGELRAILSPADASTRGMLRDLVSQRYYAATLAVSADGMLRRPSAQAPRDGDGGERAERAVADRPEGAAKRSRVMEAGLRPVPAIAPMPEPCSRCHAPSTEGVDKAEAPQDEEAVREAKKEAKRRKNRLSAARSNQKRKERVEAQKKELVELRERVRLLKGTEKSLREENRQLKELREVGGR